MTLLMQIGFWSPALAAGPLERVKETLDAVATLLADPQLQGSSENGRRKTGVPEIIRKTFNFEEMAREALGSHWTTLTSQQQKSFPVLFGKLFERSYNRLVLRFLGESRTAYGSESIEKNRALIRTTLIRKNDDELPVDYYLSYDGRSWQFSDVVVDGVSLAGNYRAQFDKIVRTSSYDALVETIQKKLEQEK